MVTTKGEGPAIGIDLGTTYSCVAVWRPMQNRVEVIPNDQGNLTTPSCVAFTNTCRLIGDAAMNQAAMNAVNTVFGKYDLFTRIGSAPPFHALPLARYYFVFGFAALDLFFRPPISRVRRSYECR
jgi:L1 cell adhesion molecule like protein